MSVTKNKSVNQSVTNLENSPMKTENQQNGNNANNSNIEPQNENVSNLQETAKEVETLEPAKVLSFAEMLQLAKDQTLQYGQIEPSTLPKDEQNQENQQGESNDIAALFSDAESFDFSGFFNESDLKKPSVGNGIQSTLLPSFMVYFSSAVLSVKSVGLKAIDYLNTYMAKKVNNSMLAILKSLFIMVLPKVGNDKDKAINVVRQFWAILVNASFSIPALQNGIYVTFKEFSKDENEKDLKAGLFRSFFNLRNGYFAEMANLLGYDLKVTVQDTSLTIAGFSGRLNNVFEIGEGINKLTFQVVPRKAKIGVPTNYVINVSDFIATLNSKNLPATYEVQGGTIETFEPKYISDKKVVSEYIFLTDLKDSKLVSSQSLTFQVLSHVGPESFEAYNNGTLKEYFVSKMPLIGNQKANAEMAMLESSIFMPIMKGTTKPENKDV
jgi:hypothetical protein